VFYANGPRPLPIRGPSGTARVHELAKVLNLTSKDVLQLLAELGEYVKSAASIVEAPVTDQIRRKSGQMAAPARWQHSRRRPYPRNNPYQDLGQPEIDHQQAADGPVRPQVPRRPMCSERLGRGARSAGYPCRLRPRWSHAPDVRDASAGEQPSRAGTVASFVPARLWRRLDRGYVLEGVGELCERDAHATLKWVVDR
jgi:hypothetical protein